MGLRAQLFPGPAQSEPKDEWRGTERRLGDLNLSPSSEVPRYKELGLDREMGRAQADRSQEASPHKGTKNERAHVYFLNKCQWMDPCRVSSSSLPFLLGEMSVAFTQAESGFQLNLFRYGLPGSRSGPPPVCQRLQGLVIQAPPRLITTQKEEEQRDAR